MSSARKFLILRSIPSVLGSSSAIRTISTAGSSWTAATVAMYCSVGNVRFVSKGLEISRSGTAAVIAAPVVAASSAKLTLSVSPASVASDFNAPEFVIKPIFRPLGRAARDRKIQDSTKSSIVSARTMPSSRANTSKACRLPDNDPVCASAARLDLSEPPIFATTTVLPFWPAFRAAAKKSELSGIPSM